MRQPLEARSPAEAPPAQRMADFASSAQLSSTLGDASVVDGQSVATFLYARLHNFSALCNALEPEEAASFVNEVRRLLTEPVMKLGGEVAQRRPDSILAVFCNNPDDKRPNHAQRGLHAAILAVHDAVQLAQVVAGKPHLAHLPMLTLAAGVHLGAAELSRRSSGGNTKVHAAGDAVEVARLLEVTAMDLNWSIATSAGTRLASAGRAQCACARRIVEQPCYGVSQLFDLAVPHEPPVLVMIDERADGPAPRGHDGLAHEPRLEIDETEGFDARRLRHEIALRVPPPLLGLVDVVADDDAGPFLGGQARQPGRQLLA